MDGMAKDMILTEDMKLLMEARDASQSGRARQIREAAGLSQAEVAAAVGMSPVGISRWEDAGRRPQGEPAVRYARLLRELAEWVADHSSQTQVAGRSSI